MKTDPSYAEAHLKWVFCKIIELEENDDEKTLGEKPSIF